MHRVQRRLVAGVGVDGGHIAALDAEQVVQDTAQVDTAGVTVPVSALSGLFPAVRTRAIRLAAHTAGLGSLSSTHTQSVDALVTDWHGQKALNLPGGNVERHEGRLVFTAT